MEKVQLVDLGDCAKKILRRISFDSTQDKSLATLIVLQGDLGAGKTTFTKALARELGVEDVVQSPTYVLMKSYPIKFGRFNALIHIDAYRLDAPEQFASLKPETFLSDPHALVVVEWPDSALHSQPPTLL